MPTPKSEVGVWLAPGSKVRRAVGALAGSKKLSDTASLTRWRAMREEAQAKTAALELQKLTGELLPAGEVLEAERRKNANVRASFRRLARSMAPLLHRATSPAEVEQLLLAEIDLQLSELARDPLGLGDQVLTMPDPQPEDLPPLVSSQLPAENAAVAQ